MILHHFHGKPLMEGFPTYEQASANNMKPNGFWLSDEREGFGPGWREWCEDENFSTHNLAQQTPFEVDMTRVLHIGDAIALHEFGRTYAAQGLDSRLSALMIFIDWQRVASLYAGLLITPYQWSCRLEPDCSWYYGWDCASACIWDTSVLTRGETEIRSLRIKRKPSRVMG